MTAIGAAAEGLPLPDPDEVATLDEATLAEYTDDIIMWCRGPYTGQHRADELRRRGMVVAMALGQRIAGVARPPGSIMSTGMAVPHEPAQLVDEVPTGEGPGSSTDPAYSSPTPVAGDRIDGPPGHGASTTLPGALADEAARQRDEGRDVEVREAAAAGGYPVVDEASARRAAEGYEPESPGGSV